MIVQILNTFLQQKKNLKKDIQIIENQIFNTIFEKYNYTSKKRYNQQNN